MNYIRLLLRQTFPNFKYANKTDMVYTSILWTKPMNPQSRILPKNRAPLLRYGAKYNILYWKNTLPASGISNEIKEELKLAKKDAEGRVIRIDEKTETALNNIKRLTEIKLAQ